jgi:hypothetical protein
LKTCVKSFDAEAIEEVPGWLYGQVTDDQIAGAMSAYNQALADRAQKRDQCAYEVILKSQNFQYFPNSYIK